MFTKSGMMVGLGEDQDEVLQVMDDLRAADVDFLTIGQYLQPTKKHHAGGPLRAAGRVRGCSRARRWARASCWSSASPLTRSSYHAGDDFRRLRAAREAAQLQGMRALAAE